MKTTLTTTILLFFTNFCFSQSAIQKQDDFWVEIERPTGGMVFSLAVNSITEVYAGMGNGVYLSNDDSNSWILTGLEGITSYSLNTHQNGNLFAGTGGSNSLYRMENLDEGWQLLLSGLDNVISIMHTQTGDLYIGDWGKIYHSSDVGESWEQVLELDNTQAINSIVENDYEVMFAGIAAFTGGGGVYRSMDNGNNWEYAGLHNKYILSLAVNSQGDIFAGSIGDHSQYYGGLYKSSDNGETWVELRNDVLVTSIVITPDDHIYFGSNEYGDKAGVFFSNDNGETWERIISGLIGPGNQKIEGLSLAPDGYLYAFGNHLHRSIEPVFSSNSIHQTDVIQAIIYPSPFSSILNISLSHNSFAAENTMVTIYDVLGNVALNQMLNGYNNHTTINTEFLKPGFYVLAIEANGQRHTKPIVKSQ